MVDELDDMPPDPPWPPDTRELPCAPPAERALLGATLISGRLPDVQPDDLASEGHRLILAACMRVQAAKLGCDLLTVEQDLLANGQLERAGGSGYLAGLLDGVPDIENAPSYARLVREAAVRRRAVLVARNVGNSLGTAEDLRTALSAALSDLNELEGSAKASSAWLSYSEVMGKSQSAADRIPTGLVELDRLIDGGLHPGSVTVVQGKPGIGKTLLATQLAIGLAAKCHVAALYADEGLRGASITIGQQLGVEKRALERCFAASLADASRLLSEAAPHWIFLDPMHKDATLEHLAEVSSGLASSLGLVPVWLLDSVQVIRSSVRHPKMSVSERVSAVMEQIRELAVTHQAIALVCSKVNRGSYKNREDAANSEELAAGFGSADIEYTSELVLHLKGNPKVNPLLKAAKNRLSAEGEFELPLRLDVDRKRYLALAPNVLKEEKAEKQLAIDVALDDEILGFVRKNPGCSGSYIRSGVRGKDAAIITALKRLVSTGRLFHQQGQRNTILYTVPSLQQPDP